MATAAVMDLVARAIELVTSLDLDGSTLARLAIAIVVVLAALRLLGRLAWVAARLLAAVVIGLLLVALLARRPAWLGDFAAWREAAVEAARDLLG